MAGTLAMFLSIAMSNLQANEFRWAFQGNAGTLDPHALFEGMTIGFQQNFYESLVGRDEQMRLVPQLAERWENLSGKVWRFHLRKGVTFHNGNPFNADDVIFSIKRISAKSSAFTSIASLIEKAEKVDEHTVDITTPNINPILPNQLTTMLIMDKEWSKAQGAESVQGMSEENHAHTHANGTGPFMVTERSDSKTVLKANPNWWGKRKHNVETAIFTPIENEDQRVRALTQGDIDLAYPIHVKYWKRLEFNPKVKVLTGAEGRTIYLGFDQLRDELLFSNVKGKNPFKDIRVRQAFQKAINLNEINSRVMRNSATPTGLMVAPQINGFSTALNTPEAPDLPAAKKLLEEAGYPNGFQVSLDCTNDRYVNDEAICKAIAGMLARIGVEVDLQVQSKSIVFKKIFPSNDYQTSFYLLGWTPESFDSIGVLQDLLVCRTSSAGLYNLGGYCNPQVDALTARIESEINPTQRLALIEEAFRIHKAEVGHVPLHQQPLSWGIRAGIKLAQPADNKFHLKYVVLP